MSETSSSVACFRHIPDGQRFIFALSPNHGQLVKAVTVGSLICEMAKILGTSSTAVASDDETFITGLTMTDSGGIEIEFSVLPRMKEEDNHA